MLDMSTYEKGIKISSKQTRKNGWSVTCTADDFDGDGMILRQRSQLGGDGMIDTQHPRDAG